MLLRRLTTCLAVLIALLISSSAFAQSAVVGDVAEGWGATFLSSAVNSHVEKDGLKYVVVAAGESHERTEAAADALAKALREGSASVVMSDDALGEIQGLDDDKIVAKAKALPIEHIAIVRVFPGGEGKPETVVVTVRDKAGEAVWALSGTKGEAVEAKEPEGGGMGVSRSAAEAVGEAVESESTADKAAREEYAKRFIWFQDMVGVNQYGSVVASWSSVYQGKYRKRLGPEKFYREVGRADLAEKYASNSSKMAWGTTMTTLGLLGVIGGGSWWMVQGISSEFNDDADTTTPMFVTAGSALVMIGGIIIMPDRVHPVSPSEARELADKHNQKLKDELGLADDYSPLPRASANSIDYSFGIGATPQGAAGVFRLEF